MKYTLLLIAILFVMWFVIAIVTAIKNVNNKTKYKNGHLSSKY